MDDVYSLIGASDIRRARDSSRENLETLIDKVYTSKQKRRVGRGVLFGWELYINI